jgi:hypothetical protein
MHLTQIDSRFPHPGESVPSGKVVLDVWDRRGGLVVLSSEACLLLLMGEVMAAVVAIAVTVALGK